MERLTVLPLYEKANKMGIVNEGDDQTKLKYLTVSIAATKTFGKLTYATWLQFFDEREGGRSGYIMKACRHTALLVCAVQLSRGTDSYVFPLAILITKGV